MGWWRCHLAQGPLAVPMQHFDHGCWDLNWKLFQWIIVSILSLIIQFGLQVGFWCSNNALTFFNFEIILVANPDYWGSIVNLKILGLRLGCCCYSFSSHCTSCSLPPPPPAPLFFEIRIIYEFMWQVWVRKVLVHIQNHQMSKLY